MLSGIRPTPAFAKKGGADFAINPGVKCGQGCTDCSSGAVLRCPPAFRAVGKNPFDVGYAIADPEAPDRGAKDAARIRQRGLVQLAGTVAPWCPASQEAALEEAHRRGIPVRGMLCPILPGIADGLDEIDELVTFLQVIGVEHVFAEAVNPRGPALRNTEEALRAAGHLEKAAAAGRVWKGRRGRNTSPT